MKQPPIYTPLTAGDVRQKGDEQRDGTINKGARFNSGKSHVVTWYDWRTISLIGHTILASDLMHLEFRRPL